VRGGQRRGRGIRSMVARSVRVTLTRARSASDEGCRLRPASPALVYPDGTKGTDLYMSVTCRDTLPLNP
jgi:hypothetical protein